MSPFFTDQQYVVTKKQRELIEDSWKRTHRSGTENVGSKAFLLILIAEPQIRQIFGLDKIPQGRLKYDPRFRKHAALISKSFDFAVKNIDFAEKLAQHFDGLGKKHALMQNRGFKPEYWKIFSDSMLETTNEINKCQKTANAWRVLIEFIVKHMKIGFEKEQLMRMRYLPTTTIIQKPTRNQLGVTRQPAIHEQMSPPGRSANERSSSWVGITSFSEDLSRLRITASQRYPKNVIYFNISKNSI
jgi:hemoglobin-like flavoprotein